jgi:hypothetical protein
MNVHHERGSSVSKSVVRGFDKLKRAIAALEKEAEEQTKESVVVGFTANYALYVHENIEMKLKGKPRSSGKGKYWDPQERAQAKFLEGPARELEGELGEIAADEVERTGSLKDGLLKAGLRLQREAQTRCPVETGNLRASAFTRLEQPGE